MSYRSRLTATAMLALAMLIATAFLAPTAHAQSPCPTQKVKNETSCAFTLRLLDENGRTQDFAIAAGPGTSTTITLRSAPLAVEVGGIPHYFSGTPAPGCTGCINLGSGCCADVCYDEANCVFTVNPCGPC